MRFALFTFLISIQYVCSAQVFNPSQLNPSTEFGLSWINPAYSGLKDNNVISIHYSSKNDPLRTEDNSLFLNSKEHNIGFYGVHRFDKKNSTISKSLGIRLNKYDYQYGFDLTSPPPNGYERHFLYLNSKSASVLDLGTNFNYHLYDFSYNGDISLGVQFNATHIRDLNNSFDPFTIKSFGIGGVYTYNKKLFLGISYKYLLRFKPKIVPSLQKGLHLSASYSYPFGKFELLPFIHIHTPKLNFLIGNDLKHKSGFLVGLAFQRIEMSNYSFRSPILISKIGFENDDFSIFFTGHRKKEGNNFSNYVDITGSVTF